MDSLGPRIKELRLEANLNKAALARRVGVSDVTISYWESGAIRQIGHERLVALAQALDCPLSRLLEGNRGDRPAPLYLRRQPPAPWQDPVAGRIEVPDDLLPIPQGQGQRWHKECYLLTPAPGDTFDFLGDHDLVALAPTEDFREPGLYLVEEDGQLWVRRVSQREDGGLQFCGEGDATAHPAAHDTRLLGMLLARWQASPL
ncbi:MAG: helix-turn-helix transcriptional regulator [Halomonas sp.]|uniref:helix-turn-helix domain-containing protein n=1 Tax=Halomonas sp. TaxID=1486246 RepID=UPI0019EF488F|nr:helix-turn-helix transcriptional regulator [Halomonas sp.]MBE0488006.1 helix-turn-helix transcriptional regulator [Halomonas sp.]